jgi:uncharacterized membrane protein YccC
LVDRLRWQRRDLARVGLQTAIATVAIYLVMRWIDPANLSWAVMAGLFTIGLSADASYYSARGRIVGALLGVALGILAGEILPGPALPGLVLAVALANMVATLWPSLRYAAITAAIVALQREPDLGPALATAAAILIGTLIAAAVSFVAWPTFGRRRAQDALRNAIDDCRGLLAAIAGSTDTTERSGRDALHARLLGHLETCHSEIAQTRFAPRLAVGTPLSTAADAVESLWHALVILDRVVSDEREAIGRAALARLEPAIAALEREIGTELDRLAAAVDRGEAAAPPAAAPPAVVRAQAVVAELLHEDGRPDGALHQGLHALHFALSELAHSTRTLAAAVAPDPQALGRAA